MQWRAPPPLRLLDGGRCSQNYVQHPAHFQRLYVSIYLTRGAQNVCGAPPVTLWPPRSMVHALAPRADLCKFALQSVHPFSKSSVHMLVLATDACINKWTDKRTKGHVENIMCPVSVDWHMDKYSMCLLLVLRSCFYHAECMLSAIAEFLVHLLGEWEGHGEVGEGKRYGKRVEVGSAMGMHEK